MKIRLAPALLRGLRSPATQGAVALLAGLALWATAALAAPLPSDFDPATMMRASEVRPGMVGVGKSVFVGTRIEDFHVRLLGVLPKARVGTDLVLCQIMDGPAVERQAGLIAGMSGSPVYVNGRLLGAIGYGFSFAKEAIGAITPIENMLRAFEPAGEPEPVGAVTVDLPSPVQVGGQTFERVTTERTFQPSGSIEAPGTLTLRPLGGVALAAGFQDRALERLREVLEPVGLTVMQGAGAGGDFGTPEMLQPGAAMAVTMMTGDLLVAGVGTLTYRSGNRILGFGHPFMDLTDPTVDVGLAASTVLSILPSYMSSVKLSGVGRVMGRINRDRAWAIGGEVGPPPRMLPLTMQLDVPGRSRSFQVEMVRHRMLTPGLAVTALMSAVDQTLGYAGEGTAEVTLTLVPEGGSPIQRQDLVYSRDVAAAITQELVQPLASFTDTPFGTLEFERVEVKARLRTAHDTAAIERIYTTQTKAKAGEDLEVNIVLRPFAQDQITRTVTLHIPDEIPSAMLRVGVCGGGDAERMRGSLNLARIMPTSLDRLVQRYQALEPANQLVVQVALPTRGVNLPDASLPSLPSSVSDMLHATRSSAITRIQDSLKVVEETEWVIQGRQVISVAVEGRPGAPKAAPPPPPQPPGLPEPPEEDESEEPEEEFAPAQAAPWITALAAPRRPAPPAGEKKPEPKPEPLQPVIRQPERWVQASRADLQEGELRGVALDTDGALTLAPDSDPQWTLPAQAVWSLAAGDGVAYAGTGNQGVIYSLPQQGEPSPLFETGQAIVHALLLDPAGNLYAGTSPRGLIYKIGPDGEGTVFFDTHQTYVWALAFDAQGRLLAGTGADGKLFRIGPDGQGEPVGAFQAPHLLSLAPGPDGEVYVGTGNNAVIYRLDPDGSAAALFDLMGGQVHALALGDEGELYAAVTPQGAVYRIAPRRAPERLFDTKDRPIFALARSGQALYTATGANGLVFRIRGRDLGNLLLKPEAGQALALALAPQGDLYVGGANPCLVQRLGAAHQSRGTFESAVLDAKATARWGALAWYGHTPQGTRLALQTRSGNTADPKDRWSEWSAEMDGPGGLVASPPAQYLQYRVTLTSDDPAATPKVSNIEIGYLPKNRKPAVRLSAPEPGAWWAKQQKIEWKGDDPDKDTLLYDVYYAVNEGAHWEPLEQGIEDSSYEWDTTEIEDGLYTVKVTATDRPTSPADPEIEEAKTLVGVDNTPPGAFILRHSVTVGDDRRVALRGQAWDATSSVRGVDYRADDDEWRSATPDAGLFDGRSASFSLTTDPLRPGDHTIEVRAFDEASNVGTDEVKVTIPGRGPSEDDRAPAEPETPAEPEPSPAPAPAESQP